MSTLNGVRKGSVKTSVIISERRRPLTVMNTRQILESSTGVKKYIYVFGGGESIRGKHMIERYDVELERWEIMHAVTPFFSPGMAIALYKGRVWIAGGTDDIGVTSRSVAEFDVSKKKWASVVTNGLREKRNYFGMVEFDGMLYAVGGKDGTTLLDSTECYTAERGWQPDESLKSPRADFAITTHRSAMFIVGGFRGTEYPQDLCHTVEHYTRDSRQWTMIKQLAVGHKPSLWSHNEMLYAIAGPTRESVICSMNAKFWAEAYNLEGIRFPTDCSIASDENMIYSLGGSCVDKHWKYDKWAKSLDVHTKKLRSLPHMKIARSGGAAIVVEIDRKS